MNLLSTEMSKEDEGDNLNAVALVRRLLTASEYQFESVTDHAALTE